MMKTPYIAVPFAMGEPVEEEEDDNNLDEVIILPTRKKQDTRRSYLASCLLILGIGFALMFLYVLVRRGALPSKNGSPLDWMHLDGADMKDAYVDCPMRRNHNHFGGKQSNDMMMGNHMMMNKRGHHQNGMMMNRNGNNNMHHMRDHMIDKDWDLPPGTP
jgi:hypothetical protein